MLEVRIVSLMAIRLLLEADVVVGLHPVAVFHQKHQPLHDIPYKERNIKHFSLLCHVNQLVVQFRLVKFPYRKDKPTQADGQELLAHRMTFDDDFLMSYHSCWLLAFGCWLLAFGIWLLAVSFWLLALNSSS